MLFIYCDRRPENPISDKTVTQFTVVGNYALLTLELLLLEMLHYLHYNGTQQLCKGTQFA